MVKIKNGNQFDRYIVSHIIECQTENIKFQNIVFDCKTITDAKGNVFSVQPERGKWLDNETSYSDDIPQTCTCSVCGIRSRRPLGDFCKWCGADMRENTDNQTTVCPMCPDCPDNCPLEADMREEADNERSNLQTGGD